MGTDQRPQLLSLSGLSEGRDGFYRSRLCVCGKQPFLSQYEIDGTESCRLGWDIWSQEEMPFDSQKLSSSRSRDILSQGSLARWAARACWEKAGSFRTRLRTLDSRGGLVTALSLLSYSHLLCKPLSSPGPVFFRGQRGRWKQSSESRVLLGSSDCISSCRLLLTLMMAPRTGMALCLGPGLMEKGPWS